MSKILTSNGFVDVDENILMHAAFGSVKPGHKWIKRERRGNGWKYYYDEAEIYRNKADYRSKLADGSMTRARHNANAANKAKTAYVTISRQGNNKRASQKAAETYYAERKLGRKNMENANMHYHNAEDAKRQHQSSLAAAQRAKDTTAKSKFKKKLKNLFKKKKKQVKYY